MYLKSIIFGLLLMSCIHSTMYAKEIYVDASSKSCDDTKAEVFCQISAALAQAEEGDSLLISKGVYEETLMIDKSITLTRRGAGTVLLDAKQNGTAMTILPGVRVKLTNINIENGKGEGAGGILNYGALLIRNCIIRNNVSLTSGGGIKNASSALGSLFIENSIIEKNIALGKDPYRVKYGGGGIYNNAPLQILNSRIVENIAVGNGGGIYSIFAGRSLPSSGQLAAEKLGVISSKPRLTNLHRAHQSGSVTLNRVQLTNNVAEAGGGIYVQGVMDIDAGVLTRNKAVFGDRSGGGGIYAHFDVALNIENSRISENLATFIGGGLRLFSTRTVSISNSSIDQNNVLLSYGRGAGIHIIKGAKKIILQNTLLVDNLAADKLPSDCNGRFISGGYNFISNSKFCDWEKAEGDVILR